LDNIAGVESSRAARLKELEKDVDNRSDAEKEDAIERIASRTHSTLSSPARSNASSVTSNAHDSHASGRRVIRFEDGDCENPNNWGRVS
jgi:hypothetical protein